MNLSCMASGIPSPSVSWVKVSSGQRTGGTELVFTNINRSEAGEYRCEASNLCANATESATVDVLCKSSMNYPCKTGLGPGQPCPAPGQSRLDQCEGHKKIGFKFGSVEIHTGLKQTLCILPCPVLTSVFKTLYLYIGLVPPCLA